MLQAAKSQSWAYLQLMRPANIVTAWADILVGFAASGSGLWQQVDMSLVWLLVATSGLYGGGVVFNDVFDAELDAQERPERPIPSGMIAKQNAIALGTLLLVLGIVAATQVSVTSLVIATTVAFAAIVYDAFSKHHNIFGPINMGICRGGNLLLGVSAVPAMVEQLWFLAIIPIAYIAAITLISQGEVHGGNNRTGIAALVLIAGVISGVLTLGLIPEYQTLVALPLIVLFAWRVIPAFVQAWREATPANIRTAVKAGVLSLIVLDAAIAAGFAGLPYGLLVLGLLPISLSLAQIFAVT
ncbi:UbiA-like protein EboC [Chroogloeocystis siderophila]|jgi:4-hydroxybenzoate polyprenyltransferase|uniref:Polyprenyltransferase n=1 Tax=Chroogloeocystis siderophila 5.2 s.c.1 TaxID=247279 RepID=A0A1U7HJ99_9CHRO|nr:UbiA-like protein EboC [Chroogloeocystis siderophila]OKH23639.1 polyprenyltransferase [Chroogloeocystis siderophila 5.2 s.c.1]